MALPRLLCVVTLCVFAEVALSQKDSLQVGVKYRPEDCSVKAKNGDYVGVHYTGKLTDGKVFDSSLERGDPIEFKLGAGQVIAGWEQGILGMCVGEKRKLRIPSHLGYGEEGMGPIPGGATLVFDVELMRISDAATDGGSPYDDYPRDVDVSSGDGYEMEDGDQMLGGIDLSGLGAGMGYGDEDEGEAGWS